MTSATLARGPPVDVRQDDDDDDALMDEDELGSLNSPGGQGNGRDQDLDRPSGRGLMIDENDGDSNSEEGISADDVVDYSANQGRQKSKPRKQAASSGSLSDNEGDADMGNGNADAGYLQVRNHFCGNL